MSDAAIAARRAAQLRAATQNLGQCVVTVSIMLGVAGVLAGAAIVTWALNTHITWQFPAVVLGLLVAAGSFVAAMVGTLVGRMAQVLVDDRATSG